jgi:cytochrome c
MRVALLLSVALLAGCGSKAASQIEGGDPERAPALVEEYGCGSCHTIDGIRGADARIGPPLRDFRDRRLIAGRLANNADNLVRWLRRPQSIAPGTVMPNMGVTEDDARDLAAYLYTH